MKALELTGKKFGRLTVLSRTRLWKVRTHWRCKCECGKETVVLGTALTQGKSLSCGCRRQEANERTFLRHGHGRAGKATRTYRIWSNMRTRCRWDKHDEWHRYGGAGLKVCERWDDFRNFLADMGEAPDGCSIDRIDNSKGYEPSNCRWATPLEQAFNTKRTKVFEIGGVKKSFRQWCIHFGVNPVAAYQRVYNGRATHEQIIQEMTIAPR